ncbi:Glutaredoxin-like protein NrdH [Vibrio stylophorae]|uniref:Glutaredoxin-like protein NrdH n=1 Tax=Vibrio stylophorae TaxID=659351 RepID=A0ABM8ZY46_9VIBR|nr:glutaredoxin-like protein NrdH [Vibrio stylophorae]CAH0535754.1 Glutaredoxin-like protein NrdH [Vibrio stylophorae]
MEVTLYSTQQCMQCEATKKAFDRHGIAYELIDLNQNPHAKAQVAALGYRQLPVVIAGPDHWSGFRPDMIRRLVA